MCKKWTSFLALFLAFAMAITGMPANYAYAVGTEIETETQSEEVLEETIEDEEEILDDEIDTEVIGEELTDDSEELGDETDESILDEEVSYEIPEETEVAVAKTSSSWDDIANLSGGYLTFDPDEDAFTGAVAWTVNNRENDEDHDNDASEIIWSYMDSRLKNLIESENEKVEMDRVTWWDAEFFDLDYYQYGTPAELEDNTKVRVTYNFGTDSNMKETIRGIGGPEDSPTLKVECTDFFYQVYYLDKSGAPTLISENFSKDSEKVTFDSKAAGAYMILRLPAEDDEIIYHFNNYQEAADPLNDSEACRYWALSSQSGGTGNVTFDIKGTNTWNNRDKDTAFTYSYGDIKFIGDGDITINTNLNEFEWGENIIFDGPNVTINGDIYPGEDKDVVLNSGVLNINPVSNGLGCRMVVNGGELNVEGKTAATTWVSHTEDKITGKKPVFSPLFSSLTANGGKINVTQNGNTKGCLIMTLYMGDSDVTVTGVNCINDVYNADDSAPNERAKLTVNATETGVLNALFWSGGQCDINAKVGVGIPTPYFEWQDGFISAEGGDINIHASTVGVYGGVSLNSLIKDKEPHVDIRAKTIGIQQNKKWCDDDMMIETLGEKGYVFIHGETQAVKPKDLKNTIVTEYNGVASTSVSFSDEWFTSVDHDKIVNNNPKWLYVKLNAATCKRARLYDPDGKYIKTVVFEPYGWLKTSTPLRKEGYHLGWFYYTDHEIYGNIYKDRHYLYPGNVPFEDDVDLYSDWVPNSYQLDFVVGSYDVSGGDDVYGEYGSYYVSGGDINPEEKQLVRYGGHTYNERYTYNQWDRFPFLLRIGYTFAGWADKFGNIFNEKDICKITHNTTLYPTWDAAQVDLFLEAGGGKVSTDAETGELVKVNVPYGSELDLNPETTDVFTNVGKIGYVLVGWKKEGASDDTASMTYQMPNDEEDPSSMDPVTLVAVWEKELSVNAPELKDIDGKPITEDETLPKNSKLFLSTTVNVNGVETPADNDVVEIYYRTVAGDYKLYTDAIVLGNDALTISAFAVEKGVVEEGTTVDDSWVLSHGTDVVKLNGGTPIVITKEATDVSDIDERDQAYYLEKESELCNDFWVQGVKSLDYAGKALTQSDIRVYFGNKKLVEKTDYTLSYKNNTNAGVNTAIMTVTFKGNYSGKREYKFTINTLDIADATVQDVSVIETGKKLNPSTKVTYELGGKVVTLGAKDFKYGDVIFAEDLEGNDIAEEDILVKPGRYEIRITGIGNYDGITSFIYEIGSKAENVLMSKTNVKLEYTKVDYVAYENGAEKKPGVTVKDGNKELTGGIEASAYDVLDEDEQENYSFTYEYLNNVEVGTATVRVMGTGNPDAATEKAYIGEKTATFTISGKAMSSAIVKKDITATWEPDDSTFDYQPLNEVYAGALDSLVDEIDDFAVTYKLGKPAKETGIRGIDAESYLELLEDEEDDDELLYDYIYEYVGDTTTAGKVSIKLTGVNGFTGTKTVSYTIKAITLNAANCTYTIDTEHDYYDSDIDETYFVYDGTQKIPGAIVADKKSGDMEEGVDYEVLYGENVKAGKNKATVVIKGMGRYSGSVTMKFDIKALDLNDVENVTIDDGDDDNDFVDGANIYYEKGGVKPDGFLSFNDEPLVLGTDYTATHKNNTKIGEATVTLKGKGNFTGTYEVKYNIVKQNLANVGIVATDIVFQDKANICKPKVTLTDLNAKALAQKTDYDANLVYTYNKSTTVKQKVKSGKTTVEKEIIRSAGDLVDLKNDIIPEGTEIRVTVSADPDTKTKYAGSKFYEGSTSTVFRVAGKDISKATVKVKDQVMTGEPIYITKDDITEITINKVPLDPSDYVIMNSTYTKNVGKGKASVTIRGVGSYGGTKVINFNIVVPKAVQE